MKREKYKFDLKSGHYIILNEAEDTQANNQQNVVNNTATVSPLPALNTEEVATETNKMQVELKKCDDELAKLQTNKVQIEDTIAKATEQFNAADIDKKEPFRQQVIEGNKKLLNILLSISRKEKEKADKKNRFEETILQLKLKVNESMQRIFPEKYRHLNESNIHTAKIYMRNLVANDEEHIIKGMADFKRAFGKSDLLYGKDKEGYFVICIDQEDFDKMYNTLEETGYMRDTIIDNIMPQFKVL